MKGKKGQQQISGIEISAFILLIGLFLLLYIILLPPGEREALLLENGPGNASLGSETGKVLLSESPGKLNAFSSNTQTVSLGPIRLFSKSKVERVELVSSLSVSHHLFKNNFKEVFFDLGNVENVKDVKLIALIKEKKGPIRILLNGRIIFDGTLASADMPINLPLSYIMDKENKLTLESAAPGWNIFSTNYYLFQDIALLVGTKDEKKEASKRVLIDPELDGKVKKATLKYFVGCNTLEEGRLSISLNSDEVFNDQVFCNYLDERTLSLDPQRLEATNTLDFSITEGDYTLDNARVVLELSQSIFPSYVLDVDSALFGRMQDGSSKVVLKLAFSGSGRKRATIYVQENSFQIDSSSNSYSKDITSMLDNGANTIKVVPRETMDITSLKIVDE